MEMDERVGEKGDGLALRLENAKVIDPRIRKVVNPI
jgi:hypothetical protein